MLGCRVRFVVLGVAVAGAALLLPTAAGAQCTLSPSGTVDVVPVAVQGQAYTSTTIFTANMDAGGTYQWTGPQGADGINLQYFGVSSSATNWFTSSMVNQANGGVVQSTVSLVADPATSCPTSGASTNIILHVCTAPVTLSPASNTTFPPGTVGSFYSNAVISSSLTATGYWWTVTGNLPPGLMMKTGSNSFQTNNPTGTPTTAGSYTFTVSVSDDPYYNPVDGGVQPPPAGCPTATATYTIVIGGGPDAGADAAPEGGEDATMDAACVPLLQSCQSTAECCGGLTCDTTDSPAICCIPEGQHCTQSSDCCKEGAFLGTSCVNNTCVYNEPPDAFEPDAGCVGAGETCGAIDCCTGLVCGSDLKCCVGQGQACDSSNPCCSGLGCDATSKKCQTKTCLSTGGACNADGDCCTGLICNGDTAKTGVPGYCCAGIEGAACSPSLGCCIGYTCDGTTCVHDVGQDGYRCTSCITARNESADEEGIALLTACAIGAVGAARRKWRDKRR